MNPPKTIINMDSDKSSDDESVKIVEVPAVSPIKNRKKHGIKVCLPSTANKKQKVNSYS